MKISVSSYSFSKLNIPQLDCIREAKKMGFCAVEFAELNPDKGISVMKHAKLLSEEAKKHGMEISCLSFSGDFVKLNGKTIEDEINRIKKMVDAAEALGVKTIRHDTASFDGRAFEAVLPQIASACREITSYAEKKGIKTTVENHGVFCQDSQRMESLYAAVNHPNFGLLCDMGNFLCADEEPEKAFGRLAGFAAYVHAKDFHIKSGNEIDPGEGFFSSRNGTYLRGAIIGHGNVPVMNCLRALKKVNYDGYIAIEFEGMEDPQKAIPIGFNNLKRFINQI